MLLKFKLYILAALVLLATVAVALSFFAPSSEESFGLRAANRGEAVADYLRNQILTCVRQDVNVWRSPCFSALARLVSSQISLPETLTGLSLIDTEEGIRQTCHAFVHFLGANEYKRTKDVSGTLAQCSTQIACGEGCFHGVIEGYFEEDGREFSAGSVSSLCRDDAVGNPTNYLACTHGIGHAFMLLYGNDVSPSLVGCDLLDAALERESCYAGVFMENVFSYGSANHVSSVDPADPGAVCRGLSDRYLSACYAFQSSFVIQQGRGDYAAGAAFCEEAPGGYRATCYRSIGADAAVSFVHAEPMADACMVAPSGEARISCLTGALVFLAQGSKGRAEVLFDLCEHVGDRERHGCFSVAGDVLADWYPGRKSELCARILSDQEAREACDM